MRRFISVEEAYDIRSESAKPTKVGDNTYTLIQSEITDQGRWLTYTTYTYKDQDGLFWNMDVADGSTESQDVPDNEKFSMENGRVVLYRAVEVPSVKYEAMQI